MTASHARAGGASITTDVRTVSAGNGLWTFRSTSPQTIGSSRNAISGRCQRWSNRLRFSAMRSAKPHSVPMISGPSAMPARIRPHHKLTSDKVMRPKNSPVITTRATSTIRKTRTRHE